MTSIKNYVSLYKMYFIRFSFFKCIIQAASEQRLDCGNIPVDDCAKYAPNDAFTITKFLWNFTIDICSQQDKL